MTRLLGGVRGRVTLTVLCVTAVLYSVLAVLLFLVVVDNGRGARVRAVGVLVHLPVRLLLPAHTQERCVNGDFPPCRPDGLWPAVLRTYRTRPGACSG